MKPADKLAIKLKGGHVWMVHQSEVDPDGDPNIIQVKSDSVDAYKANGYRLLKPSELKVAEKPAGVKPAKPSTETADVEPEGDTAYQNEVEEIGEDSQPDKEYANDVRPGQQEDPKKVSGRYGGGKG